MLHFPYSFRLIWILFSLSFVLYVEFDNFKQLQLHWFSHWELNFHLQSSSLKWLFFFCCSLSNHGTGSLEAWCLSTWKDQKYRTKVDVFNQKIRKNAYACAFKRAQKWAYFKRLDLKYFSGTVQYAYKVYNSRLGVSLLSLF